MSTRLLLILVLLMSGIAAGGDTGGSIYGVVVYDGVVPVMKPKQVPEHQQALCKCKEIPNESLVVNEMTKGIKWAVVRLPLENREVPYKLINPTQIELKNCRFTPHIIISLPSEDVAFLNGNVLHAIQFHPLDSMNGRYGVMHPPTNTPKKVDGEKYLKEPEVVEMTCDIYPWMKGFIVVHDPRYCAVTKEDGKFEIKNVPPGKYKLNIFQESCGEKIVEIEVKAGAAVDVGDVKMKKGK